MPGYNREFDSVRLQVEACLQTPETAGCIHPQHFCVRMVTCPPITGNPIRLLAQTDASVPGKEEEQTGVLCSN